MTLKLLRDTFCGWLWYLKLLLRRPLNAKTYRTNKHLLILAWKFPPQISGGIYRPSALARYAVQRGWKVTVVCEKPNQMISLAGKYMLEYTGKGLNKIFIEDSPIKPSYRFFPLIDGGMTTMLSTVDEVLTHFEKNDVPDILLASGPPFHNFVAAYYLSKILSVPYILDYRDEWSECPFPFVNKSTFSRWMESLCLLKASQVIFTTESQQKHQLKNFRNLIESKTFVIFNGWEPSDYHHPDYNEKDFDVLINDNIFQIAFVGALSDHTLPHSFLTYLEKAIEFNPELLNRIRLKFVGHKSPKAIKQLKHFKYQNAIELIDQVPKPIALKIMKNMDALLLINSPEFERYIPGKVYDYLAVNVPILVFGRGGEIEKIVKNLNAGKVIDESHYQFLDNVLQEIKNLLDYPEREIILKKWLNSCTREASAHKIIDLIESVVYKSE